MMKKGNGPSLKDNWTRVQQDSLQSRSEKVARAKKDVISPGKARTFNLLMCNQAGMRITVRRASQLRHGGYELKQLVVSSFDGSLTKC
jgi:hypothetical protein